MLLIPTLWRSLPYMLIVGLVTYPLSLLAPGIWGTVIVVGGVGLRRLHLAWAGRRG